ncbi:MAG: arylesterase [Edaphobacter sp.]
MQRSRFLLIVAVVVLSLSGCKTERASQPLSSTDASTSANGPKSNESPKENPAPPLTAKPAESDARPLIICFGDSLTAGLGTDDGQTYPDYLQADLDARGYNYRVVNEGISGNTTKDGVDRLPRIVDRKPAIVVVEFGGNDGLRGLRIEDSRANLDKIVSTLKASGAKVVLAGITLPPDYGPDYIKQFDATYALLSSKYHVPMLPFLLKGVYGVPGMMQRDKTHATAAGNKVVAKNILPLITPLLKKL